MLVHSLPEGCRLTAIFDCCHSGSVMDLCYTYSVDEDLHVEVRDNTEAMIQHGVKAGMALFRKNKEVRIHLHNTSTQNHFLNIPHIQNLKKNLPPISGC